MTSPDLYKTFDAEEPITILEPGMSLAGRYKLIKQIGRGGMGVVWSAEERAAGRKVVLKFVPSELKNFESAVTQLKESFQKIHGLQHQHICPVYTLEEDVSLGYYHVMKWLDGETLDEYIIRTAGRQQPLLFEDVLRILRPVAEALDYAHSQRIIHRDIKPSNIFIVLNDEKTVRDVQVIDFGLASEIRSSLSRVSQVQFDNSGTRPYMAPEQWRGRPQSGATDQYALAVVAYELLSGYLPFDGEDAEMLRMAVLQDPPEPIREMSEQVNAALLKALAKDGSNRFESCAQFIAALGGAEIPVASEVSSVPVSVPVSVPAPKQSSGASRTGTASVASSVDSLMKRGLLFLEDSEWKQAAEYFNKVLDIDSEYAPAYSGLLCAELKLRKEEYLGDYHTSISEQSNFKKAVRFADEEYKAKLEGYDKKIKERIRQDRKQEDSPPPISPVASPAPAPKYDTPQPMPQLIPRRSNGEGCCGCGCLMVILMLIFGSIGNCVSNKDKSSSGPAHTIPIICPENWEASQAGERKVLTIDSVEYAFRWCPPGTFMMGSPNSEKERDDDNDETLHQVTLSKGFWMLETEVTQEMWERVMGSNRSEFTGDRRLPVEKVSWNNCQDFIHKLNTTIEAGMKGVLARNDGVWRVSLPTEAQWEYACRAGTTAPYGGPSLDAMGWYTDNASSKTHVVGTKQANAWGLYDMPGNVWEWCSDWYGDYSSGVVTDPVGLSSGTHRITRGGSWSTGAGHCRSANRGRQEPSLWHSTLGFRLALVCESE